MLQQGISGLVSSLCNATSNATQNSLQNGVLGKAIRHVPVGQAMYLSDQVGQMVETVVDGQMTYNKATQIRSLARLTKGFVKDGLQNVFFKGARVERFFGDVTDVAKWPRPPFVFGEAVHPHGVEIHTVRIPQKDFINTPQKGDFFAYIHIIRGKDCLFSAAWMIKPSEALEELQDTFDENIGVDLEEWASQITV